MSLIFQKPLISFWVPKYTKMESKFNWKKWLHILGVILFIAGTLDPLEGSVIIAAGSILLASVACYFKKPYWSWFLANAIGISIGVFFLFFFSNLGGFGGKSTLSWWWGTLILPYPIGWLFNIILLIKLASKKK